VAQRDTLVGLLIARI